MLCNRWVGVISLVIPYSQKLFLNLGWSDRDDHQAGGEQQEEGRQVLAWTKQYSSVQWTYYGTVGHLFV